MRWWGWVLTILVAWPAAVAGQAGSIVGEVRTPGGVAVPVAEVELVRDSVVVARTLTSTSGSFVFPRVDAGSYRITARHLGYEGEAVAAEVVGDSATRVVVVLRIEAVRVGEVRVEAERRRARFEQQAGATVVELAGAEIERLPGLAEADVLRAIEVLPGVISTSDFSASFNVRGGAADQNLVLLDGVPIYNPFHLGGVFGVFNADMVQRTELLAGGFPARYGGRVSSVLDVRSDAGDGEFGVEAGVSLLASRVAVSTGLPRSAARAVGLRAVRARFSARRSYFDVLLSPFFDFPYHLTDLQGVAEAWTENGVWTVTGYTGADILDLRASSGFPLPLRLDWGNDVAGARWEGTIGRADVEGRASTSSFDTGIRFPDFEDTRIRSRIGEWRTGLDISVPLDAFRVGLGGEVARLEYDNLFQTGGATFGQGADRGWLSAAYGQLTWESPEWLVEVGGRVDVWDPESSSAWVEPAPRLAIKRFLDGRDAALKLAVGRYTQALHSLRDEEVPIGIDLWVTAGSRAPVVVSDQVQVGYERFLDGWSGSVEAYYRTFDGVVATNGADNPNDPTDDFLVGTGESWGADLVVRREPGADGAVDGWVTVSYLQAERTFPDVLSGGEEPVNYPPVYDRRWDIDLVLRYPLPAGVEGGLRFNFGSGLPFTRPLGAYPYYSYQVQDGVLVPQVDTGDGTEAQTAVVLGDRNAERYPPYHRLDVSFRRAYRTGWGDITPYLDLLNVYNRRDNVLFYFFDYSADPPVRSGISMLPIIPTLGVEVAF